MTDLLSVLDAFSGPAQDGYFIVTARGDDDMHDVCRACGEDAKKPGETLQQLDTPESDYCRHCYRCGCILCYSLTDIGVSEELGHFRENPPSAPLSRSVAYHIARILEAAPDDREAQALGAAAVMAIEEEALSDAL